MVMTGSGPLVVLTSHASALDDTFIARLKDKAIEKFIAYEIPIALAEQRYGAHFALVRGGLKEGDDLRVLDEDGERAFKLFRFDELGPPAVFDPRPREPSTKSGAIGQSGRNDAVMPWTVETPYVARLFVHEDEAPDTVVYATTEQLQAEIERHKKTGLYARIWAAHGKSANPNEWEEIENWERGD